MILILINETSSNELGSGIKSPSPWWIRVEGAARVTGRLWADTGWAMGLVWVWDLCPFVGSAEGTFPNTKQRQYVFNDLHSFKKENYWFIYSGQ